MWFHFVHADSAICPALVKHLASPDDNHAYYSRAFLAAVDLPHANLNRSLSRSSVVLLLMQYILITNTLGSSNSVSVLDATLV